MKLFRIIKLILRGLASRVSYRLFFGKSAVNRIKMPAIDVEATKKHNAIFYGVFRCNRCSALLNTGSPPPLGAARTLDHIDKEWVFVFYQWEHRCTGILIEGAPFPISDIIKTPEGEALLPEAALKTWDELSLDLTSPTTRIVEASEMFDFEIQIARGALPRPGEIYRIVATRRKPNQGACMIGEKFPSIEIAQEWLNQNRSDWEERYALAIFPEPGAVEYCKRANIIAEETPAFWKPEPSSSDLEPKG